MIWNLNVEVLHIICNSSAFKSQNIVTRTQYTQHSCIVNAEKSTYAHKYNSFPASASVPLPELSKLILLWGTSPICGVQLCLLTHIKKLHHLLHDLICGLDRRPGTGTVSGPAQSDRTTRDRCLLVRAYWGANLSYPVSPEYLAVFRTLSSAHGWSMSLWLDTFQRSPGHHMSRECQLFLPEADNQFSLRGN